MALMAALVVYPFLIMPYQLNGRLSFPSGAPALAYGYVFVMSFFASAVALTYAFHRKTLWTWCVVAAWLSAATSCGAFYWYHFLFGPGDQQGPSGAGKVMILATSVCVPLLWHALWQGRPLPFRRSKRGVPWTCLLSEEELSFLRERVAEVQKADLAPDVRAAYRKTDRQLQGQEMRPEAVSTLIGSLQALIEVAVEDGVTEDEKVDRARSTLNKLQSARRAL